MITVQHRDLPFVDRRAAAEGLGRLIANRPYLAGARTHRLFVLPRAGRNATTGATVDQQRHTKKAVDFLECGHDYIADVRDPGVDGRRLRLDSGRARVHGTTLFARGRRPGGATGSTNHLPLAACQWQWAMPLRLFDIGRLGIGNVVPADTQLFGSAGLRRFNRSDQLGCPQMGEPELELAVVELRGARFGCLRVLERCCLPSIAIHRLEAVE